MDIPAPFQEAFKYLKEIGITPITELRWSSELHRHVVAEVVCHKQVRYFIKMALVGQPDLDEDDLVKGLVREVWWSTIIGALRTHYLTRGRDFPFASPNVISHNLKEIGNPNCKVAWIIYEFIDGGPIEDVQVFLKVAVDSILALERIHPETLMEHKLPDLPSEPHGMRRWKEKEKIDMRKAVLGNGAFEVDNFWQEPGTKQIYVLDNEFAGWYPRYDHLAYLHHRLYCNAMRPDLAKKLLQKYIEQAGLSSNKEAFFKKFASILKPHVLRGWYYDKVRRKLSFLHKKQRLRYKLLWHLLTKNYQKLL